MSAAEIAAYTAGYRDNEEDSNFKYDRGLPRQR
jgi:hypothetical protein